MNACKQVADIIGPYLYMEASQQDVDTLEKHFALCESCRLDVARRRQCLAALSPAQPTTAEHERIMRTVRTHIAANSVQNGIFRRNRVLQLAVGVALAVVLFAAGVWTGEHRGTSRHEIRVVERIPVPIMHPANPRTTYDPPPAKHTVRTNSLRTRRVRKHLFPASNGDTSVAKLQTKVIKPKVATDADQSQVHPSNREEYANVAMQPDIKIAPIPLGVDDARVAVVEE